MGQIIKKDSWTKKGVMVKNNGDIIEISSYTVVDLDKRGESTYYVVGEGICEMFCSEELQEKFLREM